MNFNTKEGLTRLLSLINTVILMVAGVYYGWATPEPTPLPNIVSVSEESAATSDVRGSVPLYVVSARFDSASDAQTFADDVDDTATPPRPIKGFSIAFLVMLLQLFVQFFGKKSTP